MSFEGVFMESPFYLKGHDLNPPFCKMSFRLRREGFWLWAKFWLHLKE